MTRPKWDIKDEKTRWSGQAGVHMPCLSALDIRNHAHTLFQRQGSIESNIEGTWNARTNDASSLRHEKCAQSLPKAVIKHHSLCRFHHPVIFRLLCFLALTKPSWSFVVVAVVVKKAEHGSGLAFMMSKNSGPNLIWTLIGLVGAQ